MITGFNPADMYAAKHIERVLRTFPGVFTGIGERTREGNELWLEMKEFGVLDKTTLVFGQMGEMPGARFRVGMTGLTMAKYFRDQQKKMFYYLLITFSDLFKQVRKFLHF